MANSLQIDGPSLASFSVLIAMSAITLALSILFYRKSQTVKKLPKDLKVTIFSRTFNVFDPFPEKRKTFNSYLFFLIFSPLVAFSWTFLLVFTVFLNLFQAGYILGFILFVVCLNLMMTGEANEIYSNTSRLLNAIKSGTSLGTGDMAVLRFIEKVLARLATYYVVLTCLFTAAFFASPYIFTIFLSGFANFVGAITAATSSTLFLAPICTAFLFSMTTMAIFILLRKLRTRVFGFLPDGTITSTSVARESLDPSDVGAAHT